MCREDTTAMGPGPQEVYMVNKTKVLLVSALVAVGVVAGSVLERLETFRPLAKKVQTLPRFVARLKERIV